ncbi:MAG TPA: hypothetical protein GX706_00400 [Candidatus Moranbacteria bacterium]|nr:hypothetical protein [Candidatus Moranbacteria bacterium]
MKKTRLLKNFYLSLIWLFFFGLIFSLHPINLEIAQANTNFFPFEYKNPLTTNSLTAWLKNLLASIYGIIAWIAVIMIVIGGIVYMTSSGRSSQMELGKKIIQYALFGFAIVVAAPTLLKEIGDLASQSGGGDPSATGGGTTIAGILTNIMNFILTAVGVLSIISFTVAGIMFVAAGGNPTRTGKAKSAILYSIIGLSLAGAGLIIIQQILDLLS